MLNIINKLKQTVLYTYTLWQLYPFGPCKIVVCDIIVLELWLKNNSRGLDETSYSYQAAEDDVDSTRTIIVVFTVLELGPFIHLMEETGFSERNCYLKCLNRGRDCSASTRYRAVHFSVIPNVICFQLFASSRFVNEIVIITQNVCYVDVPDA